MSTQRDSNCLQAQKRLQNENYLADTLILDFLIFRTGRNKFLLCKLPNLWYFVMAAGAKTGGKKKVIFFTFLGQIELAKLMPQNSTTFECF